jgi:hypothetical protein
MPKPQLSAITCSKARVMLFHNEKVSIVLPQPFTSGHLLQYSCYHRTSNMKHQPQCTSVTFWDNLANYYHRFRSSGLNLAYEGLLWGGGGGGESKASRQSAKTAMSSLC